MRDNFRTIRPNSPTSIRACSMNYVNGRYDRCRRWSFCVSEASQHVSSTRRVSATCHRHRYRRCQRYRLILMGCGRSRTSCRQVGRVSHYHRPTQGVGVDLHRPGHHSNVGYAWGGDSPRFTFLCVRQGLFRPRRCNGRCKYWKGAMRRRQIRACTIFGHQGKGGEGRSRYNKYSGSMRGSFCLRMGSLSIRVEKRG